MTKLYDFDYTNLTVDEIAQKVSTIEELEWAMKKIFWPTISKMMEAEMDTHLGYDKHSKKGYNSGNSRNGTYTKKVLTEQWTTEIEVPRDREGTYEPKILPKYTNKTNGIEEKIINMYGLWLTTADVCKHIKDIYGSDISRDLVSNITDKIIPDIREWQWRPLETCYPIVYLDAIHYKVKTNGKIENRWVYIVIGIWMSGKKDVLLFTIWENESASFWQWVCNNLANRGVKDILIACVDWLSWFSNAIKNVFPNTEIQRCVIHQIRYSMKYVSSDDSKDFMRDLKSIYRASTLEIAEENLLKLEEQWGKKYPISVRSWKNNWWDLSTFFLYSEQIRKIIYTTNTIEWYNRQLRKVSKNRSVFPTELSLEKLLYLATKNITSKWNTAVHNWGAILGQLDAFFPDRIEKYMK